MLYIIIYHYNFIFNRFMLASHYIKSTLRYVHVIIIGRSMLRVIWWFIFCCSVYIANDLVGLTSNEPNCSWLILAVNEILLWTRIRSIQLVVSPGPYLGAASSAPGHTFRDHGRCQSVSDDLLRPWAPSGPRAIILPQRGQSYTMQYTTYMY
jgi:hypothetical protein